MTSCFSSKLLFLVLPFLQCFELYQTQSEQLVQAHYLGQFNRSNDTELNGDGYVVDVYFGCSVNGTFIHWKYLDIPLSAFRVGQVGVTYTQSLNDFNYTSTLISSERLPYDSTNEALNSMLIMTFQGAPPTFFLVTCTSNHNYTILNETNQHYEFRLSNGTVNNILLNYVLQYDASLLNISIFLCEASHEKQLVDASGGLLIAFSRYDSVGRARTLFSQDRRVATMHGILLSRTSSRTLSIVFVPHSDSNLKVACYYDIHLQGVSILTGSQSTSEHVPSTTEGVNETVSPTKTNPAAFSISIMPSNRANQVNATEVTIKPMVNTTLFMHHAKITVSKVILILTLALSFLIVIMLLLLAYVYLVKHRKHTSGKYTFNKEVVLEIQSKHKDLPMKQHVKQDQQDHVLQDERDHMTNSMRNFVCGCSWTVGTMLPVKPKWELPDHIRVGYR